MITGERGIARQAIRCGECHNTVHTDWSESGHARSDTSPLYLAMRQSTPPAACDPCHAPLRSLTEPGEMVAAEGITCDVCHTLREVDLGGPRARMELALADNTRRGTLCDAQQHYFHKTVCSPLFKDSKMCAGCHGWSLRPAVGRAIPVLTEYEEWRASPAAAAGKTCQGCHMPPSQAEVATGWKRTAAVGDHDVMDAGALRQGAAAMKLSVEDRQGQIVAEVAITNQNSGHALPTGFPGRQLVLSVSLVDAEGREIAAEGRVYGRVLVDAGGREVPFYAAFTEASDNRLGAGETRKESFSFRLGGPGAVRARLSWRRLSPALSLALGQEMEERVLAEARVSFGAERPQGGRARLPRTESATRPRSP